jgi:hypothetical protein
MESRPRFNGKFALHGDDPRMADALGTNHSMNALTTI